MKSILSFALVIVMTVVMFAACGDSGNSKKEGTTAPEPVTDLSKPDIKWRYIKDSDIYYQTGIGYCETPADERYEKLAVFVPGAYMDATDNGDGKGAHFDSILTDVLTKLGSEYAGEYIDDLKKTDPFGYSVKKRVDMYTPLYYLMESEEGYGSANVAPYWRIRSGIEQNTNASTTEINLALALENYDKVKSVDFETVWAQNHSEVERTGSSTENFIAWVDSCMKG